jgi:hypothetical protein
MRCSAFIFCFKFNLRRFTMDSNAALAADLLRVDVFTAGASTRPLFSST